MDPFIVHIDDLPEEEGRYPAPFDGEVLTLYRDLGRAAGTRHVGFGYERLLPGRRSSFTHAHETEEELVFVVAGACHVRLVDPGGAPREVALRAGHAVAFPPGTGIAHTFVNHGDAECVLLIAGERRRTDRFFYAEDDAYEAHFAATRPARHWTRGAIRAATEDDIPTLLALLGRKAAFDRTMAPGGDVVATADDLRDTMFGIAPYAWARLAERGGVAVGLATYHFRFSTFRGRPSLWLDDLFVVDDARSAGIGAAMMRDLASIAQRHRCTHMSWTAAARNTRGLAFYARLGATIVARGDAQHRLEASAAVIDALAA